MGMLLNIVYDIFPTFVSYIAVTITLAKFNPLLGTIAIVFFTILTIFSSILRYFHAKSLTKRWIFFRDKVISNQVENLQQNNLIRSSFATYEASKKANEIITSSLAIRNVMNQGDSINRFIIRMLYISSVAAIGYITVDLVRIGQLEPVLATSLILTYISASSQTLRIGDLVLNITESLININDLFSFINNFGKQSFPVLPKTDK
jgi:ABC-type transport system involved in cytochrome bd biosynthesis fused ATPase/permease subunit